MAKKQKASEMTKTSVRVDRELWDAVRRQAIDEHVTTQRIVELALQAYLKARRVK
jgi:predicted transcriptional regulator